MLWGGALLGDAAWVRKSIEAEGNGFIAANWIKETEELLPAIEADAITRYLYLLRV